MANDLKVTLIESPTQWTVDIDQKDNANQVARNANAQTITWQLNGNAATGNFASFAWVGTQPPSGIFGSPLISSNGKEMTLSDLNNASGTTGEWIYQIGVQLVANGTIYYSGYIPITGTATNPSIKNN